MSNKKFIGIDIGGTKISAAVVNSSGTIFLRQKNPTPKKAGSREILKEVLGIIENLLAEGNLSKSAINGIGIGVPGIVDTQNDKILITPNINLSGYPLGQELKKRFKTKIVIGNDVNLGVLGEKWMGAGRDAKNIVGLFPGTGIGGGVVIEGKLFIGYQGAAAELGHMIMDLDGPRCSCGNHGCLEALASRWAIERDIRQAIKNGKKSIITSLADGKLTVIKSKLIKKSLEKKDPLVTDIMTNAAKILGKACISIRHLFDPELLILGGGIIEACGDFMLPIITKTIYHDPFFAQFSKCRIVESQLGDDAVMLGAVALVKQPN